MLKYSTLNDAIALAKFAHFNQKDKAGFDYFDHPLRVMRTVQSQGAPPFVQIAAVMHDVTEDTAFTSQMLLDLGFSESAVRLVNLLDRNTSKNLFHRANWGRDLSTSTVRGKPFYISLGPAAEVDFYYQEIANDGWARMIKLADIADNTLPWRLSHLEPATQDRLKAKYAKARAVLNG